MPIGPAPAAQSYLSIERVLDAAARTGAQAIHPGYGFLSENVEFARACEKAGVVFIGPPVAAIEAMADKIRAKQTVVAAGVPVVPGRTEPGMTDDAGRRRRRRRRLPGAAQAQRGRRRQGHAGGPREGRAARGDRRRAPRGRAARFGDDTLLVERYVGTSRHIEVQVLGDAHGNVIHLGERECSLQRRHQKVIEEAPSPLLDTAGAGRRWAGARSRRPRRSATPAPARSSSSSTPTGRDDFFFLEMNTRLQVEHPVTELVTGLDLVEQQVRIAAGERLPLTRSDVSLDGHAIEARLYAEDPARGFLPQAGTVLGLRRAERAPASGSTARSPSAASSAPTTTRCWPRSSPGRPTARPRAPGWSARSGTPPSSG